MDDELFPLRANWDDLMIHMRKLIDQFYAHESLDERAAAHERLVQHIARMKLRDRPQ